MRLPLLAVLALFVSSCPCVAQDKVVSNVIVFDDEISEASVAQFSMELALAEQTFDSVVVEINSPGGELGAGMKMMKAIEQSSAQVTCRVDGVAASMAFIVLQSCDERVMTKRSVLMGHQVALGVRGQKTQMENALAVARALDWAMGCAVVAKAHISVEQYLLLIDGGHELWLTGPEALVFGFVDSVE